MDRTEYLCREACKSANMNPDTMYQNERGLLVPNWRRYVDMVSPYLQTPDPLKPEDYYCGQGKDYKDSPLIATGWTMIKVLPELIGLPWNEFTLNYLHVLRPSMIRVSGGKSGIRGRTLDCHTWRVTVSLDDDGLIKDIEQEVAIKGGSGGEMRSKLEILQAASKIK